MTDDRRGGETCECQPERVDDEYVHAALCPVAEQQQTDGVLDRLAADNDRLLATLDEVIDVEAGLQQILDRAKEA